MRKLVVVGGGIAGLATALRLKDDAGKVGGGLEVSVLEAGGRVGGNIRTDRSDGFTVEWGPNGYLDNVPAMGRIVARLGLKPEIQSADPSASKRFLYGNGGLHLLPTGALSFLRSPVLSLRGRLRVLREPLANAKPAGLDETIHEFASRRIGEEAANVLIDAMVSGVFAGDTRRLSLASAFPKMAAMEEAHGSLVRAMVARMRERRAAKRHASERALRGENVEELTRPGGPAGPGGTLTSFKEGLDVLVERLAGALGDSVHVDHRVASLALRPEARATDLSPPEPRWRVVTEAGDALEADAVVVALPAPDAAPLLEETDPPLARQIEGIRTAGLVVVSLGFDAVQVGGQLDGFGFLAPRQEGLRSLGCLWDSSIFPGRAPADRVLLRVMIGGAHDPGVLDLDDERLLSVVRRDLATAMSLTAEPSFVRIYRHRQGIAQYERGHQARLDAVAERLRELPGLWVAGSSYYGVSMNACVEKAESQAEEILRHLQGAPHGS